VYGKRDNMCCVGVDWEYRRFLDTKLGVQLMLLGRETGNSV